MLKNAERRKERGRGHMLLALAQLKGSSDKEANLRAAKERIGEAARHGARAVVFPEMFMALPTKEQPPQSLAEPLDGPFVAGLAGAAAEHGMYVACGVWERAGAEGSDSPARPYNTAAVLGPGGDVVARYRKLHLFDALRVCESETMTAGRERPPIFEIDGVPFGLVICYDLRFPEIFRDLADRGAHGVLVPAAWYAGSLKEAHWLTLLRARAIENTSYVYGANLIGERFPGRSSAFDPFGVPLGDAGEREGLLYVEFNRDRVDEVRQKLPALAHTRRDMY